MPHEGKTKHVFDYTARKHVSDDMSHGGDPSGEIEQKQLLAKLYHVLDNLPWQNKDRLKTLFTLSNIDGLTNEAIADIEGVTPERIKQLLKKVNWKVETELDLGKGYFKAIKKNKDNDFTEEHSL